MGWLDDEFNVMCGMVIYFDKFLSKGFVVISNKILYDFVVKLCYNE